MHNNVFRIGKWRVDPAAATIASGARKVRLQPRFMRVLTLLAEQPGRVITREELIEKTWPNVVVQEAALTQAISHLRTAMGPVEGAYIETIPKVGYRLLIPETSDLGRRSVNVSRVVMSVAAVIGLLGLLGLISSLGRFTPDEHPLWSTSRITSAEGLELWPAIDGAGNSVVYSKRMPDTGFDLYVQDLGLGQLASPGNSGVPVRLTQAPGHDAHAQWSPDASSILFVRIDGDACQIMLVSVTGVDERVVRDCVSGSWPTFAWSDRGNRIAVSDRRSPDKEYELTIYDADSFRPVAGPFKEENVDYRRPVFLSTDEVAFVAYEEGYTGSIRLLSIDESRTETLFPFTGPINGLAYQSLQKRFLVAGERDGAPDVFRADFSGNGSWQRVNATTPNTDRSGDHIVYSQWRGNANIYTIDLSAHYTVRKYAEVITSTQIDRSPRWSNRMDRIGFVSSRSGEDRLWVSGFNGNSPVRISGSALGRVEDFDWSPNDSSIALVGAREGRRELLILPVEDGEARVLVDNKLDPQFPTWSADGSQVFFLGGSGDVRTIMQVSASGGVAKPVGLPASSYAAQAADGTLYFTRKDSTGIWTMVEGEPRLVVENVLDRFNWALAGNSIFYLSQDDSSMLLIMSHDLGTGERTTLDRIESQLVPGRAFDISPAGNHVLLAVLEASQSDIIMLSATQ